MPEFPKIENYELAWTMAEAEDGRRDRINTAKAHGELDLALSLQLDMDTLVLNAGREWLRIQQANLLPYEERDSHTRTTETVRVEHVDFMRYGESSGYTLNASSRAWNAVTSARIRGLVRLDFAGVNAETLSTDPPEPLHGLSVQSLAKVIKDIQSNHSRHRPISRWLGSGAGETVLSFLKDFCDAHLPPEEEASNSGLENTTETESEVPPQA